MTQDDNRPLPAAHRQSPGELQLAGEQLQQELEQVDREIRAAINDLFPPFSMLVARRLAESFPPVRAAVVLTAGLGVPDSDDLRQRRIFLGAALEMLYLALDVHIRLFELQQESGDPNRSMLGSTILAGDFCFSRSAGLAVRTGSATVVEIFSEALRRVSEGHLRQLFRGAEPGYDSNRELFSSGINAAGHLAGLTSGVVTAASEFGGELAAALGGHLPAGLPGALEEQLQPGQRARWAALLEWLHTHVRAAA